MRYGQTQIRYMRCVVSAQERAADRADGAALRLGNDTILPSISTRSWQVFRTRSDQSASYSRPVADFPPPNSYGSRSLGRQVRWTLFIHERYNSDPHLADDTMGTKYISMKPNLPKFST